jgi:oxysterol-binding protein 1
MGFYLPLTEIQFRAEELEYTALLDAAAKEPKGSIERATLVAGFALSHYAATVRLDKPFLPMHGETFDIYLPDRGVRVLAETVYTNFKENT